LSGAWKNKGCLTFAVAVLVLTGCGDSGNGGRRTINPNVGVVATVPHDPYVGVLYGVFSGVPESRGDWVWGDSVNSLCQQWSIAMDDYSGWFYGTDFSWSSVDVYVLPSTIDPLSVVAAENFDYTSGSVYAVVGKTVFFRGRNGFFGAWTLEDIDSQTDSTLSGTWYFRADGGGDFTGDLKEGGTPIRQGDCRDH
jgi:hypothetical protein